MSRRASYRSKLRVTTVLAVLVVLFYSAMPFVQTAAQDRSALLHNLEGGRDFRVRVQAAFALGNLREERAIPALGRALSDQNPAVRAAAATALGRIGSSRGLPSLRAHTRDSSAAVRMQVDRSIRTIEDATRQATAPTSSPAAIATRTAPIRSGYPSIEIVPSEDRIAWPRIRYVITLGDLENRSDFASTELTASFRSELTRHLRVLRGVAVMQSDINIDERARREIRRRRLPNLRLDGNIAEVRRSRSGRDMSVRCEVSLMLLDHQERSIRGELRGAATGTEPRRRDMREQEKRLAAQALSGAVRSAMAGADQALARAAHL